MIPLDTLEFKLLMCSDPVGLFSALSARVTLMHFGFLASRMSSLLFDDIQLSYCTFNWMVSLITVAATLARLDKIRNCKGPLPTADHRRELQVAMQNYAPAYRNADDLAKGKGVVDGLRKRYKDAGISDRSTVWNTGLIETPELEDLLNQAGQEMHAAEARKASRGAHAHEYFPDHDDGNWMKHNLTYPDAPYVEEARVVLKYRVVINQPLDSERHHVPLVKRVY